MRRSYWAFFLAFVILGCGATAPKDYTWEDEPVPEYNEAFATQQPLSWELDQEGIEAQIEPLKNRKLWSNFLFSEIHKRGSVFFTGASDVKSFCANYLKLNSSDRLRFWAELMVQIAKYESGFLRTTIYREPSRWDRLTGKPLLSEGLFQMSYQDSLYYEDCSFNWSRDSFLHPLDANKSTLNPFKNIRCAVGVMAEQLKTKKLIVVSANPYWAVLSPRRPQQLSRIRNYLAQMPFCKEQKKSLISRKN